MDVRSPSAPPPFLDREHSHDVVRSYEAPVAERHHADISGPYDVFFAHMHIVANTCSLSFVITDHQCALSARVERAEAPYSTVE